MIRLQFEAEPSKNESVSRYESVIKYETITQLTKALHERYEVNFFGTWLDGLKYERLDGFQASGTLRKTKAAPPSHTSPKRVPETAMGHHDGCHDMMFDWLIEFFNKNDTTRSATQVGPRPVEAGLGGQDDGVWGVYDGVENTSIPLWKRGRTAMFVCPTFSGFNGV